MVFHKPGLLPGDGDLVGDAPEADGGVVVILVNQVLHLQDAVFVCRRVIALAAYIGNLRPYDKAVLVAGVVKVRAVLVMGKPHGVGAYFLDKGGVLIVLLPGQGIPQVKPVLVA